MSKDIPQPNISELLFAQFSSEMAVELALARTKSNRLSGDLNKWNEVIADMQQTFQESAPKVLQGITFRKDTDGKMYSDELESLLLRLTRPKGNANAVLTETIQQDSKIYQLSQQNKELIANAYGHALQSYSPEIYQLANAIDERLGIKDNN